MLSPMMSWQLHFLMGSVMLGSLPAPCHSAACSVPPGHNIVSISDNKQVTCTYGHQVVRTSTKKPACTSPPRWSLNGVTCKPIEAYCPYKAVNGGWLELDAARPGEIGATAVVHCPVGYTTPTATDPLRPTVNCTALSATEGTWAGSTNCSALLANACATDEHTRRKLGGLLHYTSQALGSTAELSCFQGSVADGPTQPAYTCIAGATATGGAGWFGYTTCKVNPTYCPVVLPVQNGEIGYFAQRRLGSHAYVLCDRGYRAQNDAACQWHNSTQGVWSQPLSCIWITNFCPTAIPIPFGKASYENGRALGATSKVVCVVGYSYSVMDGGIRCIPGNDYYKGVWIHDGRCKRIRGYCPVPSISHGRLADTAADSYLGDVATVICDQGYRDSDVGLATCVESASSKDVGVWAMKSQCDLEARVPCRRDGHTANGRLLYENGMDLGSWSSVQCNVGYELERPSSQASRCAQQLSQSPLWNTVVNCVAIPGYCPPLSLTNATMRFSRGHEIRSIATATCRPGWSSGSTYECLAHDQMAGQWSGDTHPCAPITNYCPIPTTDHGIIDFAEGFRLGAVATLHCSIGFMANNTSLVCGAGTGTHGVWKGSAGCQAIRDFCPPLSIPHGRPVYRNGSTIGAVSSVVCDRGYDVIGDVVNSYQCTSDNVTNGRWFGNTTCRVNLVYCPLGTVGHGRLEYIGDRRIASKAKVVCNLGYHQPTRDHVNCKAGSAAAGTWDSAACRALDFACWKTAVSHGTLSFPSNRPVSSLANLTCHHGYEPTGNPHNSYVCTTPAHKYDSGEWISAVKCQAIPTYCPLHDQSNVNFTYSNGRAIGSVAMTTCGIGYKTVSATERCVAFNGTVGIWQGPAYCMVNEYYCQAVTISNGFATYRTNLTLNSIARVVCLPGFEISNDTLTCVADTPGQGRWNGGTQCTPIPSYCEQMTRPLEGFFNYTGFTIGSVAKLECPVGSSTTGTQYQCTGHGLSGGVWHGTAQCTRGPLTGAAGSAAKVNGASYALLALGALVLASGCFAGGHIMLRNKTADQVAENTTKNQICPVFPSSVGGAGSHMDNNGFVSDSARQPGHSVASPNCRRESLLSPNYCNSFDRGLSAQPKADDAVTDGTGDASNGNGSHGDAKKTFGSAKEVCITATDNEYGTAGESYGSISGDYITEVDGWYGTADKSYGNPIETNSPTTVGKGGEKEQNPPANGNSGATYANNAKERSGSERTGQSLRPKFWTRLATGSISSVKKLLPHKGKPGEDSASCLKVSRLSPAGQCKVLTDGWTSQVNRETAGSSSADQDTYGNAEETYGIIN